MPYLALAVADESELGVKAGRVTIEQRIAPAIQRDLGTTVLLYRRVGREAISYFARARLAALRPANGGGRQCDLEPLHWFGAAVEDDGNASAPGARRFLALTAERFAEILSIAGISAAGEFEEGAAATALSRATDPRELLRIHDEVMRRWGYRCSVTDVQFAPSNGLHPHLRLVAIRPVSLGGPLDVRNFLPMVDLAERAWTMGVISVGPDLDFLVVPNRLESDLLEVMPPDGRLIVPEDPAEWPDAESLAFHRTRIFGVFR